MTRLVLLLAAAPSPSPSATSVIPGGGSPGILGFVFTFALAAAVILLALSMTRHLRRVDARAKPRDADEAPPAAGDGTHGADEGPAGDPRP